MKWKPYLPNSKSPHRTPASTSIDLHYAHLGIVARWDWTRYERLCAFLNWTPYELASVVCLSHASVDTCRKRNKFPAPVCLLLTLLEAQILKDYTPKDVIPNPFPHDPPQSSQA